MAGKKKTIGLTPKEVSFKVNEIVRASSDPERAHGMEDDLYIDVLKAIAKASTNSRPRMLARAALRAHGLDFPRWYA